MLPRAAACAERITEVLSTRTAIANPDHPLEPAATAGMVELVAAGFHYPGADRPVLQDVSFVARPGTTTAVVGSTGSGKSTLMSLICRLYDVTSGAVRIDGVDVRDYHTERLWSRIGLVPQRGYLFSGTVADNLRYGRADATEDADVGGTARRVRRRVRARPTPTAWTCGSPRAASTSPADSDNVWRSPAQ